MAKEVVKTPFYGACYIYLDLGSSLQQSLPDSCKYSVLIFSEDEAVANIFLNTDQHASLQLSLQNLTVVVIIIIVLKLFFFEIKHIRVLKLVFCSVITDKYENCRVGFIFILFLLILLVPV